MTPRSRMAGPAGLLAASVLAGAVLLGCGEKSEPETTGRVVPQSTTTTTTTTPEDPNAAADAQAARTSAQLFLESTKPTVCRNLLTASFLRRTYGTEAQCVSRREKGVADDAEVGSATSGAVMVDGNSATVTARASGGPYGKDQRVTLYLVRQGVGPGGWRVNAQQPALGA